MAESELEVQTLRTCTFMRAQEEYLILDNNARFFSLLSVCLSHSSLVQLKTRGGVFLCRTDS